MLPKKYFFFIGLLAHIVSTYAEKPLCISLGSGCGPAFNLRDLGLRTEAYPFDWVVSPFDALYKVLEDDFAAHLTDLTLRPGGQGVIDHYGIHYTHDWPTTHNPSFDTLNTDFVSNCELYHDWAEALPSVREKYRRRIERFRQACNGSQKVFFMRENTEKNEAIAIRDLLASEYPQLDFMLIIFNPSSAPSWNVPCIKNFHSANWHDPARWAEILPQADPAFVHLRLKITEKSSVYELYCHHCGITHEQYLLKAK